jgi:hypothetical protein
LVPRPGAVERLPVSDGPLGSYGASILLAPSQERPRNRTSAISGGACARSRSGSLHEDAPQCIRRTPLERRVYGGKSGEADCPDLDVLVVPGGPGARSPEGQTEIIWFVQAQYERVKLVASVCTGAFILARAGLLHGRKATTHSGRMELFKREFPPLLGAVQGSIWLFTCWNGGLGRPRASERPADWMVRGSRQPAGPCPS